MFRIFRSINTPHRYSFTDSINTNNFIFHPYINIKSASERLGSLHKELLPLFDNTPDIIRQTAIGIRDILPFLDQYNLRTLVGTTNPCRSSSSSRHASYNNMLHKLFNILLN